VLPPADSRFAGRGANLAIRIGDGLATIRAKFAPGRSNEQQGHQSSPSLVQTQGSLRDGGLATLLQTMQAERATGTLSLENGTDSASLYFLFGHLFHASGPGGQGEDVVIDALGWWDGSYQFDPRAKLPAEETIKASPAELIAAAESSQGAAAGAVAGARSSAIGEGWPAGPQAGTETATATEIEPAPSPVPSYTAPSTNDSEPSVAASAPEEAPVAGSGLASWTAAQAQPAPPAEPSTYRQYSSGFDSPPRGGSDSFYTPPPPATSATASPLAASGPAVFYPLPSGRALYEGLKSAFVDFPRLLRTLRADRHTGYVQLSGSGYRGVLILHDGQVREAISGDGEVELGEAAFLQFRRHMDGGDGSLDVIELNGETVLSVVQLFSAPPLFTGLLGRFINLEALLEYLVEEKVDGSVVVISAEMGVILLRQGSILGAYTESQHTLDQSTAAVAALAAERASRIEVKGGAGDGSFIDVEAALTAPY
jgi:Domain of unknown function (DUF4388)